MITSEIPPRGVNLGPPVDESYGAHRSVRGMAEPVTVATLPLIAGMCVADPMIAAAVSDRSVFEDQPTKRYFRTAHAAAQLVVGNRAESLGTASRLHAMHTDIQGEHEGVRYNANDIDAQDWVGASIFLGMDQASKRWDLTYTDEDRQKSLTGVLLFLTSFGANGGTLPVDVREFDGFVREKIDSGSLLATPASKLLFDKVVCPTNIAIPGANTLARAITVMSLDGEIREQAGITPTAQDIKVSAMFDAVMLNSYSRIPKRYRLNTLSKIAAAWRKVEGTYKHIQKSK